MKYLLLLSLLLATPAWAALPPRTNAELRLEADYIVVGTVTRIESRTVQQEVGADKVYTLTIKVDEQQKGALSSDSVRVECWQPSSRPEGWVGPQGQNSIPKDGEKVRLYLHATDAGSLQVMQPNGWESILTPSQRH